MPKLHRRRFSLLFSSLLFPSFVDVVVDDDDRLVDGFFPPSSTFWEKGWMDIWMNRGIKMFFCWGVDRHRWEWSLSPFITLFLFLSFSLSFPLIPSHPIMSYPNHVRI